MNRKKEFGFTLIELLVVIAIIALLLAILIPSLKTAKDIAKRVTCATRLKQTGTAMKLYSDTYEYLPDAVDNTGKREFGHGYAVYRADKPEWFDLTTGLPIPLRWAKLYVTRLVDVPELFYCPGNRLDNFKYESYTKPTMWGTLPQDYNTENNSNQWVRIGYTYFPMPVKPRINAAGELEDPPVKFTQLNQSLPYATDILWGRDNLSHQRLQNTDAAFHASNNYSVNALYPDAHVANCKDPEVFKHNIWDRFSADLLVKYDEYYMIVFQLIGNQ